MEAKRLLRSSLSARRAGLSAADLAVAGRALAGHAVHLCRGRSTVAAFAAVGTEPPTRPLLDDLRAAGVRVLLPVVEGNALDWAPYAGWDALVAGYHGTPEPVGDRLGVTAVADADLVLVPALAVDVRGRRLGRGAGFYDRALVAVDPDRVVAVVYDEEVLDELPAEPHDRPVGAVLTPSGLRSLTRPARGGR